MASFTAARSIFRSSAARNAAARLASQSKSKPKASPFSLNSTANKPVLRRSPVEMSFAVESMMPYHTVTASALMTSMLSISRCGYGWLPEGIEKMYLTTFVIPPDVLFFLLIFWRIMVA
ncbi:hypothetical protein Peur_028794 [Populus x canadensis]